jgi:hypothetical protein
MTDSCPHCGAPLPAVRDAFCPECRGDLSEVPQGATAGPRRDAFPGGSPGPSVRPAGEVWYATEGRLRSWFRTLWQDDRGSVGTVPGGLLFSGPAGRLVMRPVASVRLVRVVPWAALAGLVGGEAAALLLSSAGFFAFLTGCQFSGCQGFFGRSSHPDSTLISTTPAYPTVPAGSTVDHTTLPAASRRAARPSSLPPLRVAGRERATAKPSGTRRKFPSTSPGSTGTSMVA